MNYWVLLRVNWVNINNKNNIYKIINSSNLRLVIILFNKILEKILFKIQTKINSKWIMCKIIWKLNIGMKSSSFKLSHLNWQENKVTLISEPNIINLINSTKYKIILKKRVAKKIAMNKKNKEKIKTKLFIRLDRFYKLNLVRMRKSYTHLSFKKIIHIIKN